MKKELILYGAGSVGKLAIQIINDLNEVKGFQFKIKAIIDDDKSKINTSFCGYNVFSPDFLNTVSDIEYVILSLSNNNLREKISKKLIKKFPSLKFPSIIHPRAWIGNNVILREGTMVYPGVCIDPDVELGAFNVVNTSVTIGHDTVIEDFVTFSPGVNIGGFNKIGKGSFIGIGASTLQSIKIGKNATIGAGAVIIKDVPDGVTVVGNPGREV